MPAKTLARTVSGKSLPSLQAEGKEKIAFSLRFFEGRPLRSEAGAWSPAPNPTNQDVGKNRSFTTGQHQGLEVNFSFGIGATEVTGLGPKQVSEIQRLPLGPKYVAESKPFG